jgi:hypothetical protein
MHPAYESLVLITTSLPAVRAALEPEEWAAFLIGMRRLAPAFQNLQSDRELESAVERVLEPFFADPRLAALFAEPGSGGLGELRRSSRPLPLDRLVGTDVPTIAREFYDLLLDPEAKIDEEPERRADQDP